MGGATEHGRLVNLNLAPAVLAEQALAGESKRRLVMAHLRYVLTHHREAAGVIEETGRRICDRAGARELRRIAELAPADEKDEVGETVRLMLLSGFWRH